MCTRRHRDAREARTCPWCVPVGEKLDGLTVASVPRRYGQLSGMVEPAAGLVGAAAVTLAEPLLPYALAFAAGAMIYVVVDDIVPEAQTWCVSQW